MAAALPLKLAPNCMMERLNQSDLSYLLTQLTEQAIPTAGGKFTIEVTEENSLLLRQKKIDSDLPVSLEVAGRGTLLFLLKSSHEKNFVFSKWHIGFYIIYQHSTTTNQQMQKFFFIKLVLNNVIRVMLEQHYEPSQPMRAKHCRASTNESAED